MEDFIDEERVPLIDQYENNDDSVYEDTQTTTFTQEDEQQQRQELDVEINALERSFNVKISSQERGRSSQTVGGGIGLKPSIDSLGDLRVRRLPRFRGSSDRSFASVLSFLKKVVTAAAGHVWLLLTSVATLIGYSHIFLTSACDCRPKPYAKEKKEYLSLSSYSRENPVMARQ